MGKLLAEIDEAGATKDTLVIFLSDNGGERLSDSPLFHGKYTLWEGGIRVPCVIRWPGVLSPKTTSAQPVIAMDLTASILAASGGLPRNVPLDGEDILPILSGKQPNRSRTFFWRLPRPNQVFGQIAARQGQWKYIYDREMELLFDLDKDPGERRNLANQHPEIIGGIRRAVIGWENDLPNVRP